MAAGGKINTVYANHGSNTGKKIFLAIGEQTASALKARFTSSSGVSPLFPIAGSDGGATPLWSEYNFQYYGTSFLIHLTKKYTQMPMSGTDGYGIDVGLTRADTCCKNVHTLAPVSKKRGFPVISANGSRITFTAVKAGMHELTFFSSSGRFIAARKIYCSLGTTSIVSDIATPGTYIAHIKGVSGDASAFCVLGNR